MRIPFATLLCLSTLILNACQAFPGLAPAGNTTPPIAALAPLPPSTVKSFSRTAVLFRNADYSAFEVYESTAIDVISGDENTSPDFGHLQFQGVSGAGMDSDGFFVTVRKAQTTAGLIYLGHIDKGAVDPATIAEAPEGGYSSATVGKRNIISINAGNSYLLRLKTGDAKTYYCRLTIRDIEPTKITYTLVTQTESGNRHF